MSSDSGRPETPSYLGQAVYRIFREACLRCGIDRPLEVAHIRNWPASRGQVETETADLVLSATWPETLGELRDRRTRARFHDLGNVVPLCANCHTLFDNPKYTDVTESDIRTLRNAAVLRPDVLLRAVDFIGAELYGRPGRCVHKDADGRPLHSRRTEEMAIFAPLAWIQHGYRLGLDLGDPAFVVVPSDSPAHHHVALDQGSVDVCAGDLRRCSPSARQGFRRRPAVPAPA